MWPYFSAQFHLTSTVRFTFSNSITEVTVKMVNNRFTPYEREQQYKSACAWLNTAEGTKNGKPNYNAACNSYPAINYFTLRNRFLGKHQAPMDAHENQQNLSKVHERTMVEWMVRDARMAQPWGRARLKYRVQQLIGKEPSDTWLRGFNARHRDELRLRKTVGLDPKRAQCFNPGTTAQHF